MKDIYLILGSETALADRALSKLMAQLREENAETTTLFAGEIEAGAIVEALSPSLFSERRALIIRDLQDLADEVKEEISSYLSSINPTITLILVHRGGVKGKGLLDEIKEHRALHMSRNFAIDGT